MMETWLPLVLIAIVNAVPATIAAIAAIKTRAIATETKDLTLKTEQNTNSMKDALVKATSEAAHSAGKEQGRIEGEVKAAALVRGEPDNRTARATEDVAEATKRIADVAEKKA